MRRLKGTAAVLIALPVAACANLTTVGFYYHSTDSIHTQSVFSYAGGGRDLRTVIYGNPTTAPKEEFDAVVAAAMQGRNWGPPTHFTTTPGPDAREGYRVVLVFTDDPYMDRRAVCGDVDPATLAPITDGIRLHAAFCQRNYPVSSVRVSFGAIDDLSDPRLDRAVGQAVLHLFPKPEPRQSFDRDRDVEFPVP